MMDMGKDRCGSHIKQDFREHINCTIAPEKVAQGFTVLFRPFKASKGYKSVKLSFLHYSWSP
jgi:hypothetical protein